MQRFRSFGRATISTEILGRMHALPKNQVLAIATIGTPAYLSCLPNQNQSSMFAKPFVLCACIVVLGFGHFRCLADDTEADFFHSRVISVLTNRCYSCHSHSSGQMEGGLVLDWKSGWAQGGERGPAIIPTQPDDSLLIQAVEHSHSELQMPEERLPPEEIEVLREWVNGGLSTIGPLCRLPLIHRIGGR